MGKSKNRYTGPARDFTQQSDTPSALYPSLDREGGAYVPGREVSPTYYHARPEDLRATSDRIAQLEMERQRARAVQAPQVGSAELRNALARSAVGLGPSMANAMYNQQSSQNMLQAMRQGAQPARALGAGGQLAALDAASQGGLAAQLAASQQAAGEQAQGMGNYLNNHAQQANAILQTQAMNNQANFGFMDAQEQMREQQRRSLGSMESYRAGLEAQRRAIELKKRQQDDARTDAYIGGALNLGATLGSAALRGG